MAVKKIGKVPSYKKRYIVIITVVMAGVLFLYFIPLWYTFNNAFKPTRMIFLKPMRLSFTDFTFANILKAIRYLNYLRTFFNSFIVLMMTLILLITTGSLAAFALVKVKHWVFNWAYTFIILLITLPFQLAMVPMIKILSGFHLVDTRIGLSLVFTAVALPFTIFLYGTGIKSIPNELDEAATIDGCGMVQSFWHLYIPLLRNVTGTVMILRGVGVWNDFMITLITINSVNKMTLPLRLFSFIGMFNTDWGLLFSGTLLVSLPIVIAFLLMQKAFLKGFIAGSLKG
jgi:ABC-type glycerol-3-phosphate transport system permease component